MTDGQVRSVAKLGKTQLPGDISSLTIETPPERYDCFASCHSHLCFPPVTIALQETRNLQVPALAEELFDLNSETGSTWENVKESEPLSEKNPHTFIIGNIFSGNHLKITALAHFATGYPLRALSEFLCVQIPSVCDIFIFKSSSLATCP